MSPFLLLLFLSVASAPPLHADNIAHSSASTTHLHFYQHDKISNPNPTAIQVVHGPEKYKKGPAPFGFGTITVIDDILTEGPNLTTNVMGRAQGFYSFVGLSGSELSVSMNIVLTQGEFNRSVVTVLGWDNFTDPVRELSVIGGTGMFRMARGYALIKTYSVNATTSDTVLEVDLYVSDSSPNTIGDAHSSDGATSNSDAPSSSSVISDGYNRLH